MRNNCYLKPANNVPPEPTKVQPKCYSCKKFPICSIRKDYLKAASLIENLLGNPNKDLELKWYKSKYFPRPLPNFEGFDLENYADYFTFDMAATIQDKKESGSIKEVKYHNKDFIQFLCDFEDYLAIITAIWNDKTNEYDISEGKEIFYHLKYTLTDETVENFQINLLVWREDMEKKEKDGKELDLINTTYFTAELDCQFYEFNKEKKRPEDYPHLHHVATYHIEPHKVKEMEQPKEIPTGFPCVLPPYPVPTEFREKPIRRGDRDEY
jgi:hypothetical protein